MAGRFWSVGINGPSVFLQITDGGARPRSFTMAPENAAAMGEDLIKHAALLQAQQHQQGEPDDGRADGQHKDRDGA